MKYFEIATTNVVENDQENGIVGVLRWKINDLGFLRNLSMKHYENLNNHCPIQTKIANN